MTIVSTTCYTCGVPITMHDHELAALQSNGQTFYCVHGHGSAFTRHPTKDEKRIAELERRVAARDERIRGLVEMIDRERDATFEARKKARTCPLCGEVFRARGRLPGHLLFDHGAEEEARRASYEERQALDAVRAEYREQTVAS